MLSLLAAVDSGLAAVDSVLADVDSGSDVEAGLCCGVDKVVSFL